MNRLAIVMTAVIVFGIAIFYDLEKRQGVVWVNSDLNDSTFIMEHEHNLVTIFDSAGTVRKMALSEFYAIYGKKLIESIESAEVIIVPRPKREKEPKVTY